MSPDMFPATYAAARRLQEMYASGQIARPAAAPVQDVASVTSSGHAPAQYTQAPSTDVPSSTVSVTVDVTVQDLPINPPVHISVSVRTAGDGSMTDRPRATGDRRSARRADVDLRNRLRRLGPAENAR